MNKSSISVRNYSDMYSCGKGAARQQAQRILEKSQSITGYLVVTRAIGKSRYGRQVYVAIHGDLSVVGNCDGEGHKGLGKTSKSIFRIFWCTKRPSRMRGSPGGSSYEILMLEIAKSFNPNGREIRVPEYR